MIAVPMQEKVPLFIDGKFVQSKTDKWIDLRNPVRASKMSRVDVQRRR